MMMEMEPGCRIVGLVTIVWLSTEADDQSSLHCVTMSVDIMSDHTGRRDASRGGGCSKTSAHTGQFGFVRLVVFTLVLIREVGGRCAEKLTNPAFAYEGEGFRRSSSSSSLNSIFSPDGDVHIRTCNDCRELLERRDEQISRRSSRPALVVLYEVTARLLFHDALTGIIIGTAFSALTLLAGYQEGHPACKN